MRAVNGQVIFAVARHVLGQLPLDGTGLIGQLMEDLRALRSTGDDGTRELAKVRRELERQMNRRDRALEAWLDGTIHQTDMTRLVSRCEEEMERLNERAERLESRRTGTRQEEEQFQEIRGLLEQELKGGETVLEELIQGITVNQEDFLVNVTEFPVRFRVKAVGEGTGGNYHVRILECTPIPESEMT